MNNSGADRGVPRWVKVSGLVTIAILVLLVAAMLFGGEHGPGRHLGAPAWTTPAQVMAG